MKYCLSPLVKQKYQLCKMNENEKYPKYFQEFLAQFRNEDDCWNYIFDIRRPNGFVFPKCANSQYWLTGYKLIHCSQCGTQTSVTGGTIFHSARKGKYPQNTWLFTSMNSHFTLTENVQLQGKVILSLNSTSCRYSSCYI